MWVALPQQHLDGLQVFVGQLPEGVTNSLIAERTVFNQNKLQKVLKAERGQQNLTFKVNDTVREGCVGPVGSVLNPGVVIISATSSSSLLLLVMQVGH